MTVADETASRAGHEQQHARMPIPGAREPHALPTGQSSVTGVQIPNGPGTMDAATIAERQREGGGAPNQRRAAAERLGWRGLAHLLRLWLGRREIGLAT